MPPLNNLQRNCIALAISQTIAMPLQAATIVVDSISDTPSTDTCTLRSAILSANTDDQIDACIQGNNSDEIEFDLPNNSTITLTSELPTVASTITINGTGQDSLAISGNNNSRILSVTNGGDLTLSSISLINGSSTNNSNTSQDLGFGGAVHTNSATLTINDSNISNNSATYAGGGVSSFSSSLTINNSNLSNNYGHDGGGAIFAAIYSITNIDNSTVSNNSTYYANTSGRSPFGGGLYNSSNSTATIHNSTFSNNTASSGGGIASSGFTSITISNSTISNNSAQFSGGIFLISEAATINNSTISNNSARFSGGGIGNFTSNGGGAFAPNSLTITNSTVSENFSNTGAGGIYFARPGEQPITLMNNIIAGNTAGMALSRPPINDAHLPASTILLNNLFGSNPINANTYSALDLDNTNILTSSNGLNLPLNQIIEPLADNGGPTLTHALPSGSPALNAGNNAACPTTDQRGELRDDGFCDIGSFEGTSEQETFFTIPLNNGKTVIFGL